MVPMAQLVACAAWHARPGRRGARPHSFSAEQQREVAGAVRYRVRAWRRAQVAVVPDLPQAADLALRADLLAVLRGQQARIAAAERAPRGAAGRRMLAPVAPAADAVVLITDDKEFAAELRQAQARRPATTVWGSPSAFGWPGARLLALCCELAEAARMRWAWRGSWRQQSLLVTSWRTLASYRHDWMAGMLGVKPGCQESGLIDSMPDTMMLWCCGRSWACARWSSATTTRSSQARTCAWTGTGPSLGCTDGAAVARDHSEQQALKQSSAGLRASLLRLLLGTILAAYAFGP
jgi:hypothetical protein